MKPQNRNMIFAVGVTRYTNKGPFDTCLYVDDVAHVCECCVGRLYVCVCV